MYQFGPGGGILARDHVGEDRDGVRLVRAAERVQVGEVRRRILRDQRRLTVAGRLAAARAERECRGDGRGDEREGRKPAIAIPFFIALSFGRGRDRPLFARAAPVGSIAAASEPIPAPRANQR